MLEVRGQKRFSTPSQSRHACGLCIEARSKKYQSSPCAIFSALADFNILCIICASAQACGAHTLQDCKQSCKCRRTLFEASSCSLKLSAYLKCNFSASAFTATVQPLSLTQRSYKNLLYNFSQAFSYDVSCSGSYISQRTFDGSFWFNIEEEILYLH